MLGKFEDDNVVSSDDEFEIKEETENVELSGIIAYNKTEEKQEEIKSKIKTKTIMDSSDDEIEISGPQDKEDNLEEEKQNELKEVIYPLKDTPLDTIDKTSEGDTPEADKDFDMIKEQPKDQQDR